MRIVLDQWIRESLETQNEVLWTTKKKKLEWYETMNIGKCTKEGTNGWIRKWRIDWKVRWEIREWINEIIENE